MDQSNVTTGQAATPMPKYRCFKEVWALRIASVTLDRVDRTTDENQIVTVAFDDKVFAPITINLFGKPTPSAGWYYIVYEDGYKSFSPARAFEEGYMLTTLIPREPRDLRGKIARAINCHSRDNSAETPDFILGAYLEDCLNAYEHALRHRASWLGKPMAPSKESLTPITA